MKTQLANLCSKNGKDLCVSCKAETPYDTNTNIEKRKFYVEGAGQLCKPCFNQVYGINDEEGD